MMNRDILHIRLDAFFATVEQRRRPNLRGRPVIVVGSKDMLRGKKPPEAYREVVVSASREARRQGVNEGMSVRHAQRACPEAILFKADYPAYRLVFEEFLQMLSRYTPLLEPDSIGSAFMDVTAGRNLFGDPSELCARIISEVSARLDMPLCIGCAPNKLLARIASGKGKWFIRVRPGCESDFLAPLPVSVLDAVDARIDKRLGELGVTNIGQLARISERVLARQFGPIGNLIHKQANGIDFSPVRAAYPEEVITIEHAFLSPVEEPAEIEELLSVMADQCVAALRRQNTLAGKIMLAIDSGLQVRETFFQDKMSWKNVGAESCSSGTCCPGRVQDSMSWTNMAPVCYTFKKPTDSAYTILQVLTKLLNSLMRPGMEISKVSIELSGLTQGESCQLSLIGPNERANRLNRVIELISGRFGEGTIFFAASTRQTQRSAYA